MSTSQMMTLQEYVEQLPEIHIARKELASLQAELEQFRWVPVTERLPKQNCQIWICYEKTGYTYGAFYNVTYKLWQIFDPCGGWSNIDAKSPPTHWMPIPKLPEAQS